jgi:hypothetical protein
MKKLFIALLALMVLNGCAAISAVPVVRSYFMATFDNNEYMLINSVRTQANLGAAKCGTPEVIPVVDNIYFKTIELRNYSQSIPHNEETIKMSSELSEIVFFGLPPFFPFSELAFAFLSDLTEPSLLDM